MFLNIILTLLLVLSSKQESKDSKRRRCCRCGAGAEKTAFHADTPGFPLRTEPEILRDLRGFDRLELPRNNQRTVQSSAVSDPEDSKSTSKARRL
jgi:hypothetical protein